MDHMGQPFLRVGRKMSLSVLWYYNEVWETGQVIMNKHSCLIVWDLEVHG